ncbi:MAG: flagellar basal body P-ring protein FlgI [Phycisphaeraceae bacterium]
MAFRSLAEFTNPAKLACALALAMLATLVFAGCSSPTSYDNEIENDPLATFTGPRYLRGTVGSYGGFVNNKPRYMAGYGMVVDLDATGSNEVPGFMRDWMINEMRRNGLGSVQFGTERFGPERVMADLGSSVVAVEGLIPPGATQGSKYDILVTMIDQTSTSLAGGRLFWPVQMSPTGLDRRLIYTESQGIGYGEVFIDPIKPADAEQGNEFLRQAVIVNGGTVTFPQKVQFVLNQPSYRVATLISERINARFEAADTDNRATAHPLNDGLIEINVPKRFSAQPEELFALIEHLHLDPSPQFVRPQAEMLGKALEEAPADRARPVSLAWKMLGPNATPVLRSYYAHPNADVRRAALQAGAWLNDAQSVTPLKRIAEQGTAADRVWAARSLVALTRSGEARQAVREMLNDPDPAVRVGAYEALAMVRDSAIDRLSVTDGLAHKFYIDRVPSKHPMVFAVQGDEQAVVIFGDDVPLNKTVFAKIDDNITLTSLPISSIPVGLAGRSVGESAFVPLHRCGALEMIPSLTPVSDDPNARLPAPDWRVEVGDADGNSMVINIRKEALQDAFGVTMLNVPGRDTPTDKPRAVAMVRIVQDAGKDEHGKPTPAVGELLQLRKADAPLPVALRIRKPGDRETKVYRITPTVATLAYTLGYKEDNINARLGPDLTFSKVVHALYVLAEQGQYNAPFDARISEVAQAIQAAQETNQAEPRPEWRPEDFEQLDARAAERAERAGGNETDPAGRPGG